MSRCFTSAEDIDLYCGIYANSELPHAAFIDFVALRVGGDLVRREVRNESLDISVMRNDTFDPALAATGPDRWLYFPYRLEIDPVAGVSFASYVEAVAGLLTSLWAAEVDAVAACEFEDDLPRNERRLAWATK